MKAIVKATGATVFVRPYNGEYNYICDMQGEHGVLYKKEQLVFDKDEPDYWEKLHHQAAIAAMQGILSSCKDIHNLSVGMASHLARGFANELIDDLKNEK